MNSNPYYEEKLQNLNEMLEKVLSENKDIEKQNEEIKLRLSSLDQEISTNYDEIIKQIEPLKAKN